MTIKIEKGIPIPSRRTGLMNALRALEIGDSFVCDNMHQVVRNCAATINVKVSIRRIGDGQIRVWRVA